MEKKNKVVIPDDINRIAHEEIAKRFTKEELDEINRQEDEARAFEARDEGYYVEDDRDEKDYSYIDWYMERNED